MTHTYTFDNMVVIQQIGSAHIDNATAVEILRLNEQGWNCDAVHNYPQGNRCYVILSKPEPKISIDELTRQREINRQRCIKFCPADNGSFCEYHFQVDCKLSRLIGEYDSNPQEEISAQWNLAMPYMAEIGE